MKAERWQQISRLYHAVLACEGDRTAFLKQLCEGDEELRVEVESLLGHPASADALLTAPPWGITPSMRSDPRPGDHVGEEQVQVAALKEGLADRYRIDGELGRGGMAIVYLADDLRHGRKVAIKTLRADMTATIGHQRFLREIEIAARLTHPHILPLHDSGEVNGQLYYVMPHIEGESLRVRLARNKPLSIEESLRLTREIASALEYAHQRGVVHRDIKPGNVLLAEGIALVADFGIARAVSASVGQQTATGHIVGTPVYMSPEQASGGDVDARSDIYSLGCVLYEMLAGEPPFTATSAMAVLAQHALQEMPPLKTRRPDITEGLERVVKKSLAKSPADRYPTAASFADALSEATVHPFSQQRPGSAVIPNNLPKARTRFIGREKELAECARLLGEARLLTVTGIGGSGKTRLALRLAESQLQSHPDGVWFVDLSAVRDASRVAETIAVTLAVAEEPGEGLLETLLHHVRGKRLMLVLDNCEHLLDACGALVDAVVGTADQVRVLATSREGLGIEGERLFPLRSLAVPLGTQFNLDAVRSSEAVRLFVDRAQIADGAFVLDAQSAPPVVEICRRLDGIPLAIELAAARVKMLSVYEIRSRLDDRFRLLTVGHKALPRHQTLRAAFQWSYDLLTAEEQRLFRVLAVFAGGWTLEAATAVWSDAADEFEVLELMTRLADKSLVTIERLADGTTRYRMLEMSRQFAHEKLNEVGEGDAACTHHLKYFVHWVEQRGEAEDSDWFKQIGQEYENLLLALESCAHAEDGAKYALRLAGHVGGYCSRYGMYGVGRERLGAALQLPGAESPTPERASALASIGHMAWKQGAQPKARACYEESLAISRKCGNVHGLIKALEGLGWVYFDQSDLGAAHKCFEEALALARAREPRLIGICLNSLAFLAWERGDLAQARTHWEGALDAVRAVGNRWSIAAIASNLTDVALRNGAWEEVRHNLREALPIVRSELRSSANQVLKQSASLAEGMGDTTRAARWYGAAEAREHATGIKRHFHRESYTFEARVREKLGAVFARVAAEGAALGYEEALAEAQAWLEDPQRWVHSI